MARLGLVLAALLFLPDLAAAADLTVKGVIQRLLASTPAQPADLSGLDLSLLDFSGLDFKRANLAHADHYEGTVEAGRFIGNDRGS